MTIFKYIIQTAIAEYYCKIIEYDIRGDLSYSISFGGLKNYCFLASIVHSKTDIKPHIDRVEFDERCVKEGIMHSTTDLVKAALWTIKQLIPSFDKITLMDDSHLDCIKGSKLHKLSLKYDSILKYDKTWYERHYDARLPGDPQNDSTFFGIYKKSLDILDMELEPFDFIVERFPPIKKYYDYYISSKTPRQFIDKLRHVYRNEYCIEVGKWLAGYMRYLGVKVYKSDWHILYDSIEEPAGYSIILSTANMKGGTNTRGKTRRKYAARYKGPSVAYNGMSSII